MNKFRIVTVEHTPDDYPWPFSAFLEEWDGTEWRYRAGEDGDTPSEAINELRRTTPTARFVI